MSPRTALLLVAPCAAFLLTTAHAAAPRVLVVTDQAGDANGLNDQASWPADESPAPEGTTVPVSMAEYDLRSLTLTTRGTSTTRRVGRKTVRSYRCTGYTATLELAAAPKAAMYRVLTHRADHQDGTFYLIYMPDSTGKWVTELRYLDRTKNPAETRFVPLRTPAKVDRNRITFTVTAADLAPTGERVETLELHDIGADVRRGPTGPDQFVTSPLWDQLRADRTDPWKVCS